MTDHHQMVTTVTCSRRAGTYAHFCSCGFRPPGTLEDQDAATQAHVLDHGGTLWDGKQR